jgi:hypothetical protein
MGHFGIIKFYLKDFYETILAYAKARLLLAGQKNLVSGNNGSLMLTLVKFLEIKLLDEKA